MCKQMNQRQEIEADIKREVECCEASIRENGKMVFPSIIIDLKSLIIANKTYFEENGFCFEDSIRIENGELKYYAIMRPIFNGKMAENIRKRIKEAQKLFVLRQRSDLQREFCEKGRVRVNMREVAYDNRAYLEDEGFYFEPVSSLDSDEAQFWMKKR